MGTETKLTLEAFTDTIDWVEYGEVYLPHMKVTVLIPARMAATRFPGKPLAIINGKPMIQWVYERSAASAADAVIVATDSLEILGAVRAFGGKAVKTRDDHSNGTMRIAEVAEQLDSDIIVNVQGDEPTIRSEAVDAVIKPMRENPNLEMATLAEPITSHEDLFSPHVVKVVLDKHQCALYFSRSPIPFVKHEGMDHIGWQPGIDAGHLRHVGIYAYRRDFLLDYVREPACALEQHEGLEQLRALHMGARIQVAASRWPTIGVDTPQDVARAETYLKKEGRES